jgi:hypothetical protein
MGNLGSVGDYFYISENNALVSVSSAPALAEIGELTVRDNPSLQSISGLDQLASVATNFEVHDNPQLPTCNATNLVEGVIVGGAIEIFANLPDACGS